MTRSSKAAEREREKRSRRRELEIVLAGAMEVLGFRRERGLYLAPLAPGVHKWLALHVSREGDSFSVRPNVGVRHDELHAVVDRLCGRKPHPAPTLARLLGYLMPQSSANVAWEFHALDSAAWAAQAENLAQHVERYAVPWMNRYSTLGDVLDGLDEGLSLYEAELRPVALTVLGRRDEALRCLDGHLQSLRGRTDPAAEDYRRLAEGLRQLAPL